MTAGRAHGLPERWANIADSLSEAPPSTWSAPSFDVVSRLQRALDVVTDRDRIVLTLRAQGEAPKAIGDMLGIRQTRVRDIERRATKAALRPPSRLWEDWSAWMHEHGLNGSIILRHGQRELQLGAWGNVDEGTALAITLRIFRSRGERFEVVDLGDGRHAIINRRRHPRYVVERWLREHGRLVTPALTGRSTGVPAALIERATRAFEGARLTRCGLCYSVHVTLADLARATAELLAARGLDEWHASELEALMGYLLPERRSKLASVDLPALLRRPDMDEIQPALGSERWRYVGSIAPHLSRANLNEMLDEDADDRVVESTDRAVESRMQPNQDGAGGERAPFSPRTAVPADQPSDRASAPAATSGVDVALETSIVQILRRADRPMTIHEIAVAIGAERRRVHRMLYDVLKPRDVVATKDGRRWSALNDKDAGKEPDNLGQ